jgi:hypothetical protein
MSKSKDQQISKDTIQMETIDKIIQMYPELKKDKIIITTSVIGSKQKCSSNEFELIKFKHGTETFYRDKNGSIWNKQAHIVGVYEYKDGDYKYYFFKDKSKAKSISIDKYRLN